MPRQTYLPALLRPSLTLACALLASHQHGGTIVRAADGPVAHWKLAEDARDSAAAGSHGQSAQISFAPVSVPSNPTLKRAAKFDGRGSRITIPSTAPLQLGTGDFTISMWVHTDTELDDDLGDLISHFDPRTRTGFHISLRNNCGVTHSQANFRQLQFAIDAGTEPEFRDEGRPGSAVYGQTMAVHDGHLYVGTCEPGLDQAGHVYRYDGPHQWRDLGTPDKANSITGMAAFQGNLYVGSGKYRLGGSSLQESENPHLGGRVFRYLGDGTWKEVGQFPGMEAVGGMVVFRGALYVSSLYKPAEFFRYDGATWTKLDVPNGKRVEALGVFDGSLWATGYDEGHVYRFDGSQWTDLGRVGEMENTQTYSLVGYRGKLQVATWRTGKVFEWSGTGWQDRGRLGEELEVMGLLVHNGCLYGGTLPTGQIYRDDSLRNGSSKQGEAEKPAWTMLKQLDTTPDVKYRRVWTMAEFQGRLFATTLPSAHVWSMQTGAVVTWDREFPAGWHHVAAQREGKALRLIVDGEQVAEIQHARTPSLNLTTEVPWQIGAGSGDFFNGSLAEVQVERRALSMDEIRGLANRVPR